MAVRMIVGYSGLQMVAQYKVLIISLLSCLCGARMRGIVDLTGCRFGGYVAQQAGSAGGFRL